MLEFNENDRLVFDSAVMNHENGMPSVQFEDASTIEKASVDLTGKESREAFQTLNNLAGGFSSSVSGGYPQEVHAFRPG